MAIMDRDSLEHGGLTADEALGLMDGAQERIDVYTKNKKVLPPKKVAAPKQAAPRTPAAPAAGQRPRQQGRGKPRRHQEMKMAAGCRSRISCQGLSSERVVSMSRLGGVIWE